MCRVGQEVGVACVGWNKIGGCGVCRVGKRGGCGMCRVWHV